MTTTMRTKDIPSRTVEAWRIVKLHSSLPLTMLLPEMMTVMLLSSCLIEWCGQIEWQWSIQIGKSSFHIMPHDCRTAPPCLPMVVVLVLDVIVVAISSVPTTSAVAWSGHHLLQHEAFLVIVLGTSNEEHILLVHESSVIRWRHTFSVPLRVAAKQRAAAFRKFLLTLWMFLIWQHKARNGVWFQWVFIPKYQLNFHSQAILSWYNDSSGWQYRNASNYNRNSISYMDTDLPSDLSMSVVREIM